MTDLQYSAIIYAFILFHHSCDRPLTDYPDEENLTSGNSNGYNYREFRRPADSFKGKIEHKYWKGKQSVIEKFGKHQDVFVVAGDAEVDARLEAFRQIQKTCVDLLKAVEIYQKKIFCKLTKWQCSDIVKLHILYGNILKYIYCTCSMVPVLLLHTLYES